MDICAWWFFLIETFHQYTWRTGIQNLPKGLIHSMAVDKRLMDATFERYGDGV